MKLACMFVCLAYLAAATPLVSVIRPPPITSSSSKQAPLAVPLQLVDVGNSDEGYLLNVSVGTPAQRFGVTLDNDFDALHVFSVRMQEPTGTSCAADVSRERLNETASKTYAPWAGYAEEMYSSVQPYQSLYTKGGVTLGGWWADGFNDTVQIGSTQQPSTACRVVTGVNVPLNPKWEADGFLGIRPPHGGYEWINTLRTFLSDFQRSQITLYYARTEIDDRKVGGVMTFGGADSENCESNWIGNYTTDDLKNDCGWCLKLKSASISGRSLHAGQYYNVVAKSSFISAPQSALDAVVKVTGAEYDFKSDTYKVDCDKRAAMPDMVFQLPDLEYRLPAVDYARKLHVTDKRCTLMLKLDEGSVGDGGWKLGTTFFRPYCTLVDYPTQTFWLAKARH